MSASETAFLLNAASGNMAEVQLGQIAKSRASDDEVKRFGQKMIEDHGAANNKLLDIARRHNLTVPMQLSAKQKKTQEELSRFSGTEFDRAYMKEMVRDHKKDTELYKATLKTAKNEDLRGYLETTLPTLQSHLKSAQALHKKLEAGRAAKK